MASEFNSTQGQLINQFLITAAAVASLSRDNNKHASSNLFKFYLKSGLRSYKYRSKMSDKVPVYHLINIDPKMTDKVAD